MNNNIPEKWVYCLNLMEWHDWLISNHGIESEVWLQIRKVRSTERGIGLNEAVEEAICFGWIDGKMFSLDSDRYILRFTPRKPGSIWSMKNRIRAEELIAEGRMSESGMKAVREAQENGHWQSAYSSREKRELPGDLSKALNDDPVAKRNFEKWSNSQKLQALEWIEMSRRAKTRANRISRIVGSAHDEKKLF